MKPALILIDLQHDFLSENGRLPVGWEQANAVIVAANLLIRCFEEHRWLIIDVVSRFKRGSFIGNYLRNHAAMDGSEGAGMDARIHLHDAMGFPKSGKSAFANPYLVAYLQHKEIEGVVLCGVQAVGSIRATALDAWRSGLQVTLISNGVAFSREDRYQRTVSGLLSLGIGIVSLEEYLESVSLPPTPTINFAEKYTPTLHA